MKPDIFEDKVAVEIFVDSGWNPEKSISHCPTIFVITELGMRLQVGDVLFFNGPDEKLPIWLIKKDENYHLLEDGACKITQRNWHPEGRLAFYASFC